MATFKFAAGDLFDYYTVGTPTRSPAFIGFPIADFNDFTDVGTYESAAIIVDIIDLVRWFWTVKKWSVVFSQTGPSLSTRDFTSNATSELDILTNFGQSWSDSFSDSFSIGVVINSDGDYGAQSDLHNNGDPDMVDGQFALTSAPTGDVLTFTSPDPPGNTAIATATEFWPYT